MNLGGIDHDKARVFLLSTTHGAENHALAAALATLREYQSRDVIGHLHRQGDTLKQGIEAITASLGIADHFKVTGRSCNLAYATLDDAGEPSQEFRTLMLQELVRNHVLAPSLVVSFSHGDQDIDATLAAFEKALAVYKQALESGVNQYLVGQPVKPVYRKYN